MMSTFQMMCQLLVIGMMVSVSVARPQGANENQEVADTPPNMSDIQKFYNALHSLPGSNDFMETSPLERMQMQYLRNPPLYANSDYRGYNQVASGGSSWDPLYRVPEIKRQVRYRQCYFNPISCFRK